MKDDDRQRKAELREEGLLQEQVPIVLAMLEKLDARKLEIVIRFIKKLI